MINQRPSLLNHPLNNLDMMRKFFGDGLKEKFREMQIAGIISERMDITDKFLNCKTLEND
jgi:hypothetical protein